MEVQLKLIFEISILRRDNSLAYHANKLHRNAQYWHCIGSWELMGMLCVLNIGPPIFIPTCIKSEPGTSLAASSPFSLFRIKKN